MTPPTFGDIKTGRRRVASVKNEWGDAAKAAIRRAVADAKKRGLTIDETIEAIDAAYPFGERRHWPYKIWLSCRGIAIRELRGAEALNE